MPTGIYKRTKPKSAKQIEAARKTIKKAQKLSRTLPRTQKQLEASRDNGHKTGSQNMKIAREIASKLPRSPKQLQGKIFADDIVEHHNDLCHGDERPDDVTYMAMKEHSKLHARLRIEDGIIPFLHKET